MHPSPMRRCSCLSEEPYSVTTVLYCIPWETKKGRYLGRPQVPAVSLTQSKTFFHGFSPTHLLEIQSFRQVKSQISSSQPACSYITPGTFSHAAFPLPLLTVTSHNRSIPSGFCFFSNPLLLGGCPCCSGRVGTGVKHLPPLNRI